MIAMMLLQRRSESFPKGGGATDEQSTFRNQGLDYGEGALNLLFCRTSVYKGAPGPLVITFRLRLRPWEQVPEGARLRRSLDHL